MRSWVTSSCRLRAICSTDLEDAQPFPVGAELGDRERLADLLREGLEHLELDVVVNADARPAHRERTERTPAASHRRDRHVDRPASSAERRLRRDRRRARSSPSTRDTAYVRPDRSAVTEVVVHDLPSPAGRGPGSGGRWLSVARTPTCSESSSSSRPELSAPSRSRVQSQISSNTASVGIAAQQRGPHVGQRRVELRRR